MPWYFLLHSTVSYSLRMVSIRWQICKRARIFFRSATAFVSFCCSILVNWCSFTQVAVILVFSESSLLSFVTTVFTFLVYLCYLVFQLFSHKNLYDFRHADVQSVAYPSIVAKRLHISERRIPLASSSHLPTDGVMDPAQLGARSSEAALGKEEEIEEPEMGLQTSIILLIVVTTVCRWFVSLIISNSNCAK